MSLKSVSWLNAKNSAKLNSKVPSWLRSCMYGQSVFLAGGALRSIFDKTPVSDYDMFFKSPEAAASFEKELATLKAKKIWDCPQGSMTTYEVGGVKVQCIRVAYYASAEALLKTFDFTATCFAYDSVKLYFYHAALKDAKAKRLVINNITYPVATLNRVYKYIQKGYYVPDDTYLKIIEILSNTDFDPSVLRRYVD